ncbi:hypothetical protein GCM10009416_26920 [Craurococcus roseus]|uniref:Anti-sigma factor NepR domain-containing protein n=2 Tax=Craurococcus roseus TaxID=77585 RepID=A0ABP3QF22_9PROT
MVRGSAFMLKELPAASSLPARTMSKAKSGGADDASAHPRATRSDKGSSEAFDIWLQQGLHKLYDSVAKEPVPDELLKLIEQDLAERNK